MHLQQQPRQLMRQAPLNTRSQQYLQPRQQTIIQSTPGLLPQVCVCKAKYKGRCVVLSDFCVF
jgi:hypothetical protein